MAAIRMLECSHNTLGELLIRYIASKPPLSDNIPDVNGSAVFFVAIHFIYSATSCPLNEFFAGCSPDS